MDAKSYFLNPSEPRHRHYEALRAMHAGGLSRKEAARQFGMAPSYLKKLSAEFQQALRRGNRISSRHPRRDLSKAMEAPPRVQRIGLSRYARKIIRCQISTRY